MWILFVVALLAPSSRPVFAETSPLEVELLLVREGRIYLAIGEGSRVDPGDRLLFGTGRDTVATALIAIREGPVVVGVLTSGELPTSKKKRSRLRVWLEPHPFDRPALLRAGYPSGVRASPLFRCPGAAIRSPRSGEGWRIDSLGIRSYRLIRDRAMTAAVPWPDTLLIRLFDEAADEEIALERGELDIALFWPGELSRHMREDPRWRGFPRAVRSRGVLALLASQAEKRHALTWRSSPIRKIQALDRDLFRGDLETARGSMALAREVWMPGTDSSFADRFTVDASIPARAEIERFLNVPERAAPGAGMARYHLTFLDLPVDSLRLGVPAPPEIVASAGQVPVWLLPVGLPLLVFPERAYYIRALGAATLADLLECRPAPAPR